MSLRLSMLAALLFAVLGAAHVGRPIVPPTLQVIVTLAPGGICGWDDTSGAAPHCPACALAAAAVLPTQPDAPALALRERSAQWSPHSAPLHGLARHVPHLARAPPLSV